MQTNLSVNLNKVALLRNQRLSDWPNMAAAARVVLDAGAQGITVHPRPDGRRIRLADVHELGTLISAEYGGRVEVNVEGFPSTDFLDLVLKIRPAQVTLVPDAPDQKTSDHGWELATERFRLRPIVSRLKDAAEAALAFGLGINAGHDLSLANVPAFKKAIPMLAEVSIGHAITADALRLGFPAAVEQYLRAVA